MTIHFAPVDEPTADLLSLVADTDHPSVGFEWDHFRACLITASLFDGVVRPNDMRPMLAGKVAPRRVGSFYRKACLEGLIVATDEWQTSDDAHGRNVGKPARIYRRTSKTFLGSSSDAQERVGTSPLPPTGAVSSSPVRGGAT